MILPIGGLKLDLLYRGVPSGCERCDSAQHCATSLSLETCGDELTERIQRNRRHSLRHYYSKNYRAKTCAACGLNRINARATMCKSCAATQREARRKTKLVTDAA